MPRCSCSEFADAYIATALWCGLDETEEIERFGGIGCAGRENLAPETLDKMTADARRFFIANENAIFCEGGPVSKDLCPGSQAAMAGHDFWLTRCGHGAGFWDGDWPEPAASQLDTAAREFGNVDLYVGDDGLIYLA